MITLIALAAVGFSASVAMLWWTSNGSAATTSSTPVPATSPAHVPDNAVVSTALAPNPAMQKAGPPDAVAERTAADAAQNAARAAAELAAK